MKDWELVKISIDSLCSNCRRVYDHDPLPKDFEHRYASQWEWDEEPEEILDIPPEDTLESTPGDTSNRADEPESTDGNLRADTEDTSSHADESESSGGSLQAGTESFSDGATGGPEILDEMHVSLTSLNMQTVLLADELQRLQRRNLPVDLEFGDHWRDQLGATSSILLDLYFEAVFASG
jgi:hypothetical protein